VEGNACQGGPLTYLYLRFEWKNGSHTCFHRPCQIELLGLVDRWSPGLRGDKPITKLVNAHYSRWALEPGIMLGCMHSTGLSEYAAGNVAVAAPVHSNLSSLHSRRSAAVLANLTLMLTKEPLHFVSQI